MTLAEIVTYKLAQEARRQQVETACHDFQHDAALQRTTEAILDTLHNRHVGISAVLAANLAPLLLYPEQLSQAASPWDCVRDRLLEDLKPENVEHSQVDLLTYIQPFSARPGFVLLRIVEPLVRDAIRVMKLNYLFSESSEITEPLPRTYQEYADAMDRWICRLAAPSQDKDNPNEWDLFWKDLATILKGMVIDSKSRQSKLPESSPLSRAAFYRLNPKAPRDSHHLRSAHIRKKAEAYSPSKTEGVSEIKKTTSLSDLPDMLTSELINPEVILHHRIYNEGFNAKQREAPDDKKRDVLVCTFLPSGFEHTPTKDTLQAVWFETVCRFSWQLLHWGLSASEIRWIEGDPLGRHRSHSCLLHQLTGHMMGTQPVYPPSFRYHFTEIYQWMPMFLDPTLQFELPEYAPEEKDTAQDALREWVKVTWRSQKDNTDWTHFEQSQTHRHASVRPQAVPYSQFSHIIAMVFLPAQQEPATNLLSTNSLRSMLRTHSDTDISVICTFAPHTVTSAAQWKIESNIPLGQSKYLFPSDAATGISILECLPEKVGDKLMERWLTLMKREVTGE